MAEKDWVIDNWIIKPEEMFNLKDKIAIVTGAASGLGRAIALGLDAFGANVVLADINEEGLEEVSQELRNDHLIQKMDWTKLEDVKETLKNAVKEFNHIDISFNIPGINIRKTVFDLTYEEWNRVININLNGMFQFAKEAGKLIYDYYKQFKGKKSGSMINMASVFAEIVMPRQVAYAASKGAIRQMTKVMAAEWAPYVRVNAIGPCYIETPLVKQVMEDKKWYDNIRKQNVLRRFGKPEEVVGTAIFLASDASTLYTGNLLMPDAGWHWFGGWTGLEEFEDEWK